jgi:NitT/TauT family transport system permease protein
MSLTMEPSVEPTPPGRGRRTLGAVLPPLVAFAVLFGGWELFVRVRDISPLVLPAPSAIVRAVWDDPTYWLEQARVTGWEAFLGLLVATIVAWILAIAMAESRTMDRALSPVVTMIQVTPVIALATPLVIWLGFGLAPKIVKAALITFVPMVVNLTTGLRSVDPDSAEVLASVGASRVDVFRRLRVPHAMPYLFSALRVCVGLALIGALVAEWFGSTEGLGRTMVQARNSLAITDLWAAVGVLAVMGVLANGVVRLVERYALRWYTATGAN